MSLKAKLIIGVTFIYLGLIIMGLTGVFSLNRVVGQYSRLVDQSVPKLGDISGMRARAAQARAELFKISSFGTNTAIGKSAIDAAKAHLKRYGEIAADYKNKSFFSPEEESKFNQVSELANQVNSQSAKILETIEKNPDEAKLLLEKFEAVALGHQKSLLDLDDYIVEKGEAWSNESREMADRSIILLATTAILTIVISLVGIIFFVVRLTSSLKHIVGELQESANEVRRCSDQVTSASNHLSSSTTEQAAALEETVTATNEVASMIKTTADNSQVSLGKAFACQKSADVGKNSVDEMVVSINSINQANQEISNQVNHSNTQMKEIIEMIGEISNKTKVINEIVFQTKLLSFNASVEAARAGEAGKGFSVVAEEISKLAEMSGKSAEDIRTLLDQSNERVVKIINQTKDEVIRLVKAGEERVERGINTAARCRDILNEINSDVVEMVSLSTQITDATKEQSLGINEINSALNQIGLATNQNADASRECSTTANTLIGQVQQTNNIINELIVIIDGKGAKS